MQSLSDHKYRQTKLDTMKKCVILHLTRNIVHYAKASREVVTSSKLRSQMVQALLSSMPIFTQSCVSFGIWKDQVFLRIPNYKAHLGLMSIH